MTIKIVATKVKQNINKHSTHTIHTLKHTNLALLEVLHIQYLQWALPLVFGTHNPDHQVSLEGLEDLREEIQRRQIRYLTVYTENVWPVNDTQHNTINTLHY